MTRQHRRRHRDRGDDRADDLLRNADVAMYAAKAAGKGRYGDLRVRDDADVAASGWSWRPTLRRAVERDELLLHYQPIVSTGDRRDLRGRGAGALGAPHARADLLPQHFIPLAEETGLIVPLGALGAGARRAARLQAWQRRSPEHAARAVASTSRAGSSGRRAVDDAARTRSPRPALEPRRLVLEITESVLMQQTDAVLERLQAAQGARRAAGDRRLRHRLLVAQLPAALPDRHPQDRQAVRRGCRRRAPNGRRWPARSSGWATRSSCSTIAEGIERGEQRAALLELGCDLGQGHYFSRALPPDGIGRLLTARRAAAERRMSASSPLTTCTTGPMSSRTTFLRRLHLTGGAAVALLTGLVALLLHAAGASRLRPGTLVFAALALALEQGLMQLLLSYVLRPTGPRPGWRRGWPRATSACPRTTRAPPAGSAHPRGRGDAGASCATWWGRSGSTPMKRRRCRSRSPPRPRR